MKRPFVVGFDRRVRCDWLDAIASQRAAGLKTADLRRYGHRLLRGEFPGNDARGKTLTVIFHLWVDVPERASALRDAALKLLPNLRTDCRVALHWGLGLATYPFYRDVADATGRLCALQGDVSLAQLQRRLAERWGQRPTAERAAQRIVRSWIDWGMLKETGQRGTYSPAHRLTLSAELSSWMVEAVLVGTDAESQPVSSIRVTPQLFPFDVQVSAHELRRSPRLVVHRQGIDEDIVALRPVVKPSPSGRRQLSLL